jgi:hypothetical protein
MSLQALFLFFTYLGISFGITDGFPSHVASRTMHAHAWSAVDAELRNRGSPEPESPRMLAARFAIDAIEARTVTGWWVEILSFESGRLIADALGRFCRSADSQPLARHVLIDEKIDETAAAELRVWLLPAVRLFLEESAAARSRSAVSPDVVLKLWSMSRPRIDADFIPFDEAQDSDAVMLSVLARQQHAQVICMGDPYQQIYEWRGAVNAMSQIAAPECALTE